MKRGFDPWRYRVLAGEGLCGSALSIQPLEFFGNSKRQFAERGGPVHLERRPVWCVTGLRF
jgi:hypothetical protein